MSAGERMGLGLEADCFDCMDSGTVGPDKIPCIRCEKGKIVAANREQSLHAALFRIHEEHPEFLSPAALKWMYEV